MSKSDGAGGSRAKQAWTYTFGFVAVVAAGVVVAGLLQPPPAPELTTAPPTTTPEPAPEPQQEYVHTSEPVEYPATIPGCEVVEPPVEHGHFTIYSGFYEKPGYDNPRFPWLTGPKATAMSDAVLELLPEGTEVEFARPSSSLVFQPIIPIDEGQLPEGTSAQNILSWTTAHGQLRARAAAGDLWVSAALASAAPPPCRAGELDERRTLPDGTVLDTLDTWSAVNDVRTLELQATAYHPDGSRVSARSTDSAQSADGTPGHSGTVPLSLGDLAAIVTDPRLRTSSPVPPGTPGPAPDCEVHTEDAGRQVTREDVDRLGAALAAADLGGLATDRPLGSLQVTGFGTAFCTSLNVTTPGREATLELGVAGGQQPPGPPPPDPSSGDTTVTRTLDDGTVVTRSATAPRSFTDLSGQVGHSPTGHTVTVTRPGGTQVTVTSRPAGVGEPLPLDLLESLALTPGLEL